MELWGLEPQSNILFNEPSTIIVCYFSYKHLSFFFMFRNKTYLLSLRLKLDKRFKGALALMMILFKLPNFKHISYFSIKQQVLGFRQLFFDQIFTKPFDQLRIASHHILTYVEIHVSPLFSIFKEQFNIIY